MSHDISRTTPPDWNAIWAATQELSAAIAPLLEEGNLPSDGEPPEWLAALVIALDVADDAVKAECLEGEDAEI